MPFSFRFPPFVRRTRVQRRRPRRMPQFGRLESRQLLAGVSPDLNLVVNGDFSDVTNTVSSFYDPDDVAGWEAGSTDEGQLIQLIPWQIEGRGNVLDLDSTDAVFDAVFQDIDTLTDEDYILSFELRNWPGAGAETAPDSNDVEVLWDGESVGVFRGLSYWQTVALTVTGGTDDVTRLEFREVGDSAGGDGEGPLLDNICLVNVTERSLGNGSFEEVGTNPPSDLRFAADEFSAWSAYGTPPDNAIVLQTGTGEVGSPPPATDGSYGLVLDGNADNVDRIHQQLATSPGATYFISFDYRAQTDEVTAENELRVRFNNEWAGTFHGSTEWQRFGVVVSADSASTNLVFREPGDHLGDGTGPFVDNVRVYLVTEQTADLTVDLNGNASGTDTTSTYQEGSGESSILLDPIELTNVAGDTLTGATARLLNPQDGDLERLNADPGSTGISVSYDSGLGLLTLSGTATLSQYEAVLQGLTYENESQDPHPADRQIEVRTMNGGRQSEAAMATVAINTVNDPPELEPIEDAEAVVGETLVIQANATDPDDSALLYSLTWTGSAIGTGNNEPTISDTGEISWNPSRSGTIEVTVEVEDAAGATDSQVFEITANIIGDVPTDFVPFSGQRQLSNVTPALRDDIYSAAPALTIDPAKTYRATLTTADGDMVFELYPNEAPLAVNSFVNLANDGYFDGLTFHRVIDGFVAQGGDPLGQSAPNLQGTGGPGYTFADEFDPSLRFVGSGVLAMANSGVNTNGSQFFITYSSQAQLNDVHTIFGQLTAGSDVLDAITRRVPGSELPGEIIYFVGIEEI